MNKEITDAVDEINARKKCELDRVKENALTATIISLIIAVSFVLAAIGNRIDFALDYDAIKNIFFSSLMVLIAIVFIENTRKLVITCAVCSGAFIATGLYLIWAV